MAFGSILSIARSAIMAHQTAIQVTSHNIANAETPGYTRQRAILQEGTPMHTAAGVLGSGVRVADIGQIRDTLLDVTFRRDTSNAAGFGMRRDLLGQVEGVFNEPTDHGLAATLDQFWNSWADLANAPDDSAARTVVRQRGAQVAFALNGYATSLEQLAADTAARLTSSIDSLNGAARQIAELNVQIVAAESAGQTAGDLRDARNRLLDTVAGYAGVQVIQRGDGSAAVLVANQTLVDGASAKEIVLRGNPPAVQLAFAGAADALPAVGGQLGALVDVLNGDLVRARSALDELTAGIVDAVNSAHRAGWSPAAEPGGTEPAGWAGSNVDFFDPAGVTAASMGLAVGVQGDAGMIAAGNVFAGTGDNSIALSLSRLRDTSVPVGAPPSNVTLGAFYRDIVTGVALETSAARSSATVYDTLAAQAEVRRQSVSGVATDEELIQLMRHQQAYVAATRLVTVADEMAQALLDTV